MSEIKTEEIEIPRFRQLVLDGLKARQLYEIFEIINKAVYPAPVNLYFTDEYMKLEALEEKQSLFITILIKRDYFIEYCDMIKNAAFAVNTFSLASAFNVPSSGKTELDLHLMAGPVGEELEFHVSHDGYWGTFSSEVVLEDFDSIAAKINPDGIVFKDSVGTNVEFTLKFPVLSQAIEWLGGEGDDSAGLFFTEGDEDLYLKWDKKEYTFDKKVYTLENAKSDAEVHTHFKNWNVIAAFDQLPGHHARIKICNDHPFYYMKTTSGGNIEIRLLASPLVLSK